MSRRHKTSHKTPLPAPAATPPQAPARAFDPFALRAELQRDLRAPLTRTDAAELVAYTFPVVEHALRRSVEAFEELGLTKNETYQTVKAAHTTLLKMANEKPWRKPN